MKKPEKPNYSNLKDRQYKSMIDNMEYFMTSADSAEAVNSEEAYIKAFIRNLESFSMICPKEKEFFLNYLEGLKNEAIERIKAEGKR